MSKVDADFSAEEREALVAEIRAHLPAYLSPAATEIADPAGDVRELLNLRRADLRRVVAVHLTLSDTVRSFIADLQAGLRNPLTSSERPKIVSQVVRGPIDWGATIRRRVAAGYDETLYVVRPAERIFDIPENRALVWLLRELDRALRQVSVADEGAAGANGNWADEIRWMRNAVTAAQSFHWLRGIQPERPSTFTLRSLRAARTAFYKVRIPDTAMLVARLTESPTAEDISELICARYFEPGLDWQLFEAVVALRLARAFAAASTSKRKARMLIASGRGPFATYELPGGDTVRLWYQAWPPSSSPSAAADARARYSISSVGSRPDLVLERVRSGLVIDALLLELKASRSASTLADGLMQLLGYLKDRPSIFGNLPSAWLVAPASDAFVSREPEDRELWAVASGDAAPAAVERLTADHTSSNHALAASG